MNSIWSTRLRQELLIAAAASTATLIFLAYACPQAHSEAPRNSSAEPSASQPANAAAPDSATSRMDLRLREGTKITDVLGTFKVTGDRANFYVKETNQRFGGLENLNLARVVNTIINSPDEHEWAVSGIITEYRGSNYVLITKVIRKTKGLGRPTADTAGSRDKKEKQPRP